MDRAGIPYMADVPENTQVYLSEPQIGVPVAEPGHRGKPIVKSRQPLDTS